MNRNYLERNKERRQRLREDLAAVRKLAGRLKYLAGRTQDPRILDASRALYAAEHGIRLSDTWEMASDAGA
jgi:hypothetical protein